MTTSLTKIAANFVETTIDDEAVVMDIRSGNFFSLKGTALTIWELIDGTRDRAAILAGLYQAYPETDKQEIANDLDSFLAQLSENALVAS